LVQAIIYQQLNAKAADTIFARFQGLFGNGNFPLAPERGRRVPARREMLSQGNQPGRLHGRCAKFAKTN
jgi:3-methyladenine DNA glycosylase/8-oxoguanine DNA glycosylase